VGREHGAPAGVLERCVERPAGGSRALERREGGVALVEVQDVGIQAHGGEHPHAAHAEQHVLRQPGDGIAHVELRGDPAREARVLRALGVEQEHGDPPGLDAPDLHGHVLTMDGHLDGDGPAVVVAHEHGGRRSGSVGTQYSCCQPLASRRWRK
jgi:hypothetical protein